MGGTCVEHDAPVAVTFPRGRPFPALLPVIARDVTQEDALTSVP